MKPTSDKKAQGRVRRSFLGLRAKDVADAQQRLLQALEEGKVENSGLQERIRELESTIGELELSKGRLESFLEEARRLTGMFAGEIDRQRSKLMQEMEERRRIIVEQAGREAGLMLREAEEKARALVADAEQKLGRLHEAAQLADAGRTATISRIKALLMSQVEFLEALESMELETLHSGLMSLYTTAAQQQSTVDFKSVIDTITKHKGGIV